MSRKIVTAPQRVLSASFRALALCACFVLTLAAQASTLTVTNLSDTGSGSLRNAIAAATSGDTINFGSTVTGTITLGSTLTISQNLTIQGPGANVITLSGNGAVTVLQINASVVSISGLTIANGSGTNRGGGISNNGGTVTVSDCTISGNLSSGAFASGGGVFTNGGTTTIDNCTFFGNSASGNGGEGGAIFDNSGTVRINNSTFSGNFSSQGGAIFATTGTVTVSNSTFSGNSASTANGGTTSSGGAIFNSNSTVTVYSSTFSGNSASASGTLSSSEGGAIFNNAGPLTVNNSIFSGNSTQGSFIAGGGIAKNTGTSNVSNSVFFNNTGGDCSSCTSNTNAITTDPKLLPLGSYGGGTQTMLPQPGSSAICAGSSSLVPGGTTTDQRGFLLVTSCVDAGAVQTNYLAVKAPGDPASFLCPDAIGNLCSLRGAITQANTDTKEDIDFASNVTGTITLTSALPAITGQVNIVGPGANQLSISGGGSTAVGSVLTVNSGAQVFLYGLTIANGNNGTIGGGGVYNSGTLTVMDSAISGNQANNHNLGGGILNSGTLTLTGDTVSGNSAVNYYGGGVINAGNMTVAYTTFSGNSAYDGAAIENLGPATVSNSTFSGNAAGQYGGGILNDGNSVLNVNNSIFSENIAASGGAGMTKGGVGAVNATYNVYYNNLTNGSESDCSFCSVNSNATTASSALVGPLQLNGIGATVPTMIPLPGSPAICAGLQANIPSGITTDERGYPNTNSTYTGYSSSSPCVDAGAVQTHYTAIQFDSSNYSSLTGQAVSPAPVVSVTESGQNIGGIPVTLGFSGAGTATGLGPVTTVAGTGATFSGLAVDTAGSDTLSASVTITPSYTLTATSAALNVAAPQPAVITAAFGPAAIVVGGTSTTTLTVTITNPNTFALTDVAFSNTFPSGLVIDQIGAYTCATSATSGGSASFNEPEFSIVAGTLAAGASCTAAVLMHATTTGLIVDTTSTVTSNEAAPGVATSATLSVNPVFLGTNPVGTATSSTVALNFTSGGTIVAPVVLTQGATGLDFTDARTGNCITGQMYNMGDVCTVGVTFNPTAPGVRLGAVELKDAAGNVLATAFFSGVGNAALLASYAPATQTVADSSVATLTEAMDGAGNLYIGDVGTYSVIKVPNESGTLNPAHQSTISTGTRVPVGITVDGAGNVYYLDLFTAAAVRIPAGGGTETTVGGSFTAPYAIAVDTLGNVYVADGVHNASSNIDVITPGSNTHTLLTTVAANVSNGASLAFDGAGNLYLVSSQNSSSDSQHGSVIKIPNQSGVLNGGAQSVLTTTLATPGGMTFDAAGNLYVTVQGSTPTVELVPNVAGALDFAHAVSQGSGSTGPTAVVMDGLGTLYMADPSDAKIYRIDRAHSAVSFASTTIGQSTAAQTVTIGNIGNVALQLTGAPVQTDANDFTIAPAAVNGCDTTGATPLNAGLACYLTVSFNPQTAIAATNVLTIASNALNTAPAATLLPATLTMTGTGLAAAPSIGTTTITQSFGNFSSGTATVTGVSGLVLPTGTLSYSIDSGAATNVTLSSGHAALSIPSLSGGAHTLSLTYGGDGNYVAVTTPVVVHFTTTQASTTVAGTTVTQSYGAAVSSTITVTGFLGAAVPTGTVSYSIDGGATTPLTLSGGTVSLPVPGTLAPGPHSIALSYSGDGNYTGSTGSISFTTSMATLTVTATNAFKLYGTVNPTLAASYTGQQNGDTFTYTVSTAATASSPVGTYDIVPSAVTGVHSSYYTIHLVNGTLSINEAAVSIALAQTAPATAGVGTGVNTTFTATLLDVTSGSTGTPTGSVQFFDGATSLGTSTLTAGVATITTSFSTAATHVITAQYLGDGNFNTITSTGFNEVVVTPGFTVVANPSTLTIAHGGTGSATLTFTPTGNYTGTVALNCSGLPVFSSCIFTPAGITFTGNNAVQTAQLQIYTLNVHDAPGQSVSGMFWLPAGVLACILAVRRRRLGRVLRSGMLLVLAALAVAGISGCGSGATFVTPTGSDTVTITAVGSSGSGTLTQTATISVTITQ